MSDLERFHFKVKTLSILFLSLSSYAFADEAPDFEARFLVPGKLEYFPRMIIDQITGPEELKSNAKEIRSRMSADATVISITQRPFELSKEQAKVISSAFIADESAAERAFKNMPLIGPQRVFALMNVDGAFGAIILDFRVAVVITKVRWIGDGYVQADRSWSRSASSSKLARILDAASARATPETPYKIWQEGDRYHKVADPLKPEKPKAERDNPAK